MPSLASSQMHGILKCLSWTPPPENKSLSLDQGVEDCPGSKHLSHHDDEHPGQLVDPDGSALLLEALPDKVLDIQVPGHLSFPPPCFFRFPLLGPRPIFPGKDLHRWILQVRFY